ncbi:MAG: hypothetical protein JXQ97_09745 [Natronospirillum sp.]
MMTPLRHLGARLMFVFAVGSLWSVGYLVGPFLADSVAPDQLLVLRKITMLLALLCFAIVLLARAQALQWRPWQDTVFQVGGAASAVGIMYVMVDGSATASPILYGIVSLLCVAWVAFQQ